MVFSSRGQSGLEYILSYGWAMVLIITIASVMFFVLGAPYQKISLFSSDDKIVLKSITMYDKERVKAVFENLTGTRMKIKAVYPIGFHDCRLNEKLPPLEIEPEGLLTIICSLSGNVDKKASIRLEYADNAGFAHYAFIGTDNEPIPSLVFFQLFGLDLNDQSGFGNNCSFQRSNGTIDNWVFLDGENFLSCGSGKYLNLTGSFSIAAWINPSVVSENSRQAVIAKGCNGNSCTDSKTGFSLFLEKNSNGYAIGYLVPGQQENLLKIDEPEGKWQHFLLSYNAIESNTNFFLNGNLKTGFVSSNQLDSFSAPLTIGSLDGKQKFRGKISNLRIYNQTLLPEEACNICRYRSPSGTQCDC